MAEFPDYLAETLFFRLVDYHALWPNASLETLSGEPSVHGPYATDMVRRVEEAWRTPLRNLTCEQVRLLLGQRMGLEWLARPILEFITAYPDAPITNYEGEMVALALQAAKEINRYAPDEFRRWLNHDVGWIDDVFDWDDELHRDVSRSLASAREHYG